MWWTESLYSTVSIINTLQKYQPQPVRTPKQTIFILQKIKYIQLILLQTASWTALSPIFHDAALNPPNTLKTTEEVLAKYPNLQKETKLSELDVKLSRESFFFWWKVDGWINCIWCTWLLHTSLPTHSNTDPTNQSAHCQPYDLKLN